MSMDRNALLKRDM